MQRKYKIALNIALLICVLLLIDISLCSAIDGQTDNSPDWFYPSWAAEAKYNKPIVVRDTDSAIGRYSLKTKEIGLKDLARVHGHMCDGLVIAFIEIKAILQKLFPNGVIDRTDLRAVSKNGPCWVDAVSIMTGARINFRTLRIDNAIGDGFIIQRISTEDAYEVRLKPGIFPDEQAALESNIRRLRAENRPVSSKDIDRFERMANDLNKKLLNTSQDEILEIKHLSDYRFIFNDLYGNRGDIINKYAPRE